ncbi:ObirOr5-Q2 [Ooceraea biroi]|uniref:Odorant receptor n=2 Tax=Ooceraea biroi TaxID=2015173 RepID=A0A3L8E1F6_OOCBI|nr:odorant receptor 2a isoform X2 [Ooceraea biroi]RLU26544.1 ObirOr5-Q2 [Ooceraea biroi]
MQAKFNRASNIITWNSWPLKFLGLWPSKVNDFLYIFFTVYMLIYYTMAVRHLIKQFGHLGNIVDNLTDNILLSMILGKMIILRRSCGIMAKFVKAIKDDFSINTYSSVQETMAYLRYNEIALVFTKVSMGTTIITAISYYLRMFIANWRQFMSGNYSYELPYPAYFFEIKDTTSYTCVCIYLTLMVPIIICGYAGADAYLLSMILHVCGQFAALTCKVNNLLKNHKNYRRNFTNIVLRHQHLITLAEILENNFNYIFLQQIVGTVFILCLTSLNMLANSEFGDNTNFIVFLLYTSCVFMTIFGYCYIGDCLITESSGLQDAFYNIKWYKNPPQHTRLISICMTRAEKPLTLTAGKFCILSLSTFTNIVKTSMAYMSLLRKIL